MDSEAPQCPFDFPAAMRDRILEEVTLHGETLRCSLDLSSAFSRWSQAQIDDWCEENQLVIFARHDGRIVIRRVVDPRDAIGEWLLIAGIPADKLDPESFGPTTRLEDIRKQRFRAEVEAMDWPEVIDG